MNFAPANDVQHGICISVVQQTSMRRRSETDSVDDRRALTDQGVLVVESTKVMQRVLLVFLARPRVRPRAGDLGRGALEPLAHRSFRLIGGASLRTEPRLA